MFGLNVELKRDDFTDNFEIAVETGWCLFYWGTQPRCFSIVLLVIFRRLPGYVYWSVAEGLSEYSGGKYVVECKDIAHRSAEKHDFTMKDEDISIHFSLIICAILF